MRIQNLVIQAGTFRLGIESLEVGDNEILSIMGPTGSGKTVLLETLAGLRRPATGSIELAGQDVTSWLPEQRRLGFVYQDALLFPHLSVRSNISFGLAGTSSGARTAVVEEMASLLGIAHTLDRRPASLSGGERQRVALARALALRPRVLLLDEAFNALDEETHRVLLDTVVGLHARFPGAIVHVTHSLADAFALGERICVLGEGRVQQVGTPVEVAHRPSNEFVARFMSCRNIFPVAVSDGVARTAEGLNLRTASAFVGRGHAVIRPESIVVVDEAMGSEWNILAATVTSARDLGALTEVRVAAPPRFELLLPSSHCREQGMAVGKQVTIGFSAESVHVCQG